MDHLNFSVNNTAARTLSNVDTGYRSWSALYGIMKNDSVQETVKESVTESECKGEFWCRMYSQ